MPKIEALKQKIQTRFEGLLLNTLHAHNELTLELAADNLLGVARALRDESAFQFEMLMDLCGVDYLHYGLDEWTTTTATGQGFERGVSPIVADRQKPRFAVVYHLLSTTLNHRLRLRCYLDEALPRVDSVVDIWPSANWYEREAFDLFGFYFDNHPDLRRLLTDYGFVGHPFRKDFPQSGFVEVRYDATQKRVVQEPVSIRPRVLMPKVIRSDNRYSNLELREE